MVTSIHRQSVRAYHVVVVAALLLVSHLHFSSAVASSVARTQVRLHDQVSSSASADLGTEAWCFQFRGYYDDGVDD